MNIYKTLKEEITVGAFKDILLPTLNKLSDLLRRICITSRRGR